MQMSSVPIKIPIHIYRYENRHFKYRICTIRKGRKPKAILPSYGTFNENMQTSFDPPTQALGDGTRFTDYLFSPQDTRNLSAILEVRHPVRANFFDRIPNSELHDILSQLLLTQGQRKMLPTTTWLEVESRQATIDALEEALKRRGPAAQPAGPAQPWARMVEEQNERVKQREEAKRLEIDMRRVEREMREMEMREIEKRDVVRRARDELRGWAWW